jgi:hypothetical protein
MRNRAFVVVCIGALSICWHQAVIANSDEKGPDTKKARPDLSKFPKLQGKLQQGLGGFPTFAPPKPGESFQLDLKDVLKLKKLNFNGDKSEIILPGPVVVDFIHYYSDGSVHSMRLVSKKGSSSVTIDIGPVPAVPPKRVRVWVVGQSQVVEGVLMIDCEYEGAFPRRPK